MFWFLLPLIVGAKPLLLAFHGYTDTSSYEHTKWSSLNNADVKAIGSPNGSWNAFYCCGKSLHNNVTHQVVIDQPAIVTGWSNGGFYASLLARTPPPMMIGVIPMGGYQYSMPTTPMAVMMHHGLKDDVVRYDGCCLGNECNQDIENLPQKCVSIQSVFNGWVTINQCSTTIQRETASYRMQMGRECLHPTELYLWKDEGHSWNNNFPNVGLVDTFIQRTYCASLQPTCGKEHVEYNEYGCCELDYDP